MVAKVRERLAVSKQIIKKFDVEKFNLRTLNELEVRKEYQTKISNRFAALDNLSDSEEINRAWQNMKDTIEISTKKSISLYELKQHKPWFYEKCWRFLDQRKNVNMQWYKDPNQSSVENLNSVGPEASRHFRKKRNIWKLKLRNLKLTVRSKISETLKGTSKILRRITSL